MNRDDIRRAAYRRMADIEHSCDNSHVPVHLQVYWLLNYLIAEGLETYFSAYGHMSLSPHDADTGKRELCNLPLNDFERDCIKLLNHKIEELESRDGNVQRLRYL